MFVFCSVATGAWAQIGGRQAYDFLQLPVHARLSALGGINVSLADKDINFLHNNPALAGDTLNGFVSAAYQFYVGNVGNAMFSYAHDFKRFGQLLAGIQHTSYGRIQGFDESGTETLEYYSGETAILIGKTHRIGHFRLGATMKAVFSNIAGYRATAMMLDLGGIFLHPDQDITIGVALKNMGITLSDYHETASSNVPFDVQAGMTVKPEHMPLRFSVTGYHLVRSGLLYDDPDLSGKKPSSFKRLFSHINMGAEILLHKNANVLVGYNYLLHQALIMGDGGTGAGLSFGFSLFVKPVEFVFSRSAYSIGNAAYSFTLSTNTNQILKMRKY
ncbi:MAG TPA: type IX secretion system protein PorQ [Chryseosolibacter sp.]|nr:type IX secretion system protein PorQ [Chryseosolibacter sp.]